MRIGVPKEIKSQEGRVALLPAQVELLIGDASKARRDLGWNPTIKLPELVSEMVAADLRRVAREQHIDQRGY